MDCDGTNNRNYYGVIELALVRSLVSNLEIICRPKSGLESRMTQADINIPLGIKLLSKIER